jgi:hypothetical protein
MNSASNNAAMAVEAAVLVAVLHLPPLQEAFATAPLPWQAWPLLALGPALLLGVDELVKWVERARLRARARAVG